MELPGPTVTRPITGAVLVIGTLVNETDHAMRVVRPITIKIATVGEEAERILTSVYCPVSDQETYIFNMQHVLFVNRLHRAMVNHYKSISDELYSNLKNPSNVRSEEDDIDTLDKLDKPEITTFH